MPKLKTSQTAAKRIIKRTRTGKLLRLKMSAQHRRKGKSPRAKRAARRKLAIARADRKRLSRLVPYR